LDESAAHHLPFLRAGLCFFHQRRIRRVAPVISCQRRERVCGYFLCGGIVQFWCSLPFFLSFPSIYVSVFISLCPFFFPSCRSLADGAARHSTCAYSLFFQFKTLFLSFLYFVFLSSVSSIRNRLSCASLTITPTPLFFFFDFSFLRVWGCFGAAKDCAFILSVLPPPSAATTHYD
jgi:hypothetical protein